MKRSLVLLTIFLSLMALTRVYGQKVNGRSFIFPEGKKSWSDTLFRKLQTKQMADQNIQPVLLGIRYRYVKPLADGFQYDVEIINTSPVTKLKFKVVSKRGMESFTIRLKPGEARIFHRTYLTAPSGGYLRPSEKANEILFDFPVDELIHNRD